MISRRQVLLGTVATGVSAGLSSPAIAGDRLGKTIDAVALKEIETAKAPGAALVITRSAGPLHVGTYGSARHSDGSSSAISDNTLFRIGSVTKMFVSTAALSLAGEHAIALDAPAANVLFDLASAQLSRSATLRLALNHSTGLMELLTDEGPADEGQLARQVLAYGDAMQIMPAGKFFSYSAPGYNLAGLLLERAARKPFADVLAQYVTGPLGMARSGFRPQQIRSADYTEGHGLDKTGTVFPQPFVNNPGDWPDGFLATNLADMTRFLRALLGGGVLDGRTVIPPGVVETLLSAQVRLPALCQPSGAGFDRGLSYGFGWFHQTYRGVPILHHGGWITGFGAMAVLVPQHDLAIFAASSMDNFHLPKTVRAALDALLPVKPTETATPSPQPVTEGLARQLVGRYRNKGWADFSLETRGKDLFRVDHDGNGQLRTRAQLFSLGPDHLQAVPVDPGTPSELHVLRDERGSVAALLDVVFAVPRV
ncbi:serine hydrolase domain-containing protein [Labrys neptuniae]